jgi:phenylalanyl-tRNA synthetase alpha chain
MSDLNIIRTELLAITAAADTLDAIEAVRVKALGKASEIAALMKTLGGMTPEQRQLEAPLIQNLRTEIADAIAARKAELEAAALDARLATEKLDMTLPAETGPQGSVHPVSQVMDELAEIFADRAGDRGRLA